ncbi:hypothetical protein CSOJ01_02751 [Colletotrichum sojae]|uniref:DUF7918 domain-containing protein n=1 Tax=Colletotrichum sojae TaxID=2175907 RepID=A0A8H6JPK0_9PEZI|nr:hypothetical protein CSOJ01_02751 [Colletotrichum sojae]
MAITESLPFINVTVRPQTSFSAAKEYPDPNDYVLAGRYVDDFERTARNYIESQHHVEYTVHINIEKVPSIDEWIYENRGIEFVLLIDGQFMGKRFCHLGDFRDDMWHFGFSGKRYPNEDRTSVTTRNFRFETITTVDDNVTDREIARVRNLGNIEVKAYIARQSGQENLKYGEALKGHTISHGTSFSVPSERTIPNQDRPKKFPKILTGGLLATYHFKYRSREVLKSEQIIPRTPSPEPRLQQRAVHFTQSALPRFEDLDNYEVERLARDRVRQINDQERQGGSVKKRGYDDFHDFAEDGSPADRLYKVVKLRNGYDAIDLTGHN